MELVMLDKDDYSYSLSYLKPNDYLFSFVAFDNADNYIFGFFGSESGAFAIGLPEEFYALLGLNLVGIGFIISVGYISVVGFKDVESKYSKFDEMMQRDSSLINRTRKKVSNYHDLWRCREPMSLISERSVHGNKKFRCNIVK